MDQLVLISKLDFTGDVDTPRALFGFDDLEKTRNLVGGWIDSHPRKHSPLLLSDQNRGLLHAGFAAEGLSER